MLHQKIKMRKGPTIGAIILLLLFFGLSILTYQSINKTKNAQRWVFHTQQVLSALSSLSNQLYISKNTQLYYLFTQDPSYWQQYQTLSKYIDHLQFAIRQLIKDNPTQQENLNQLNKAIDHYQINTIEQATQAQKTFIKSQQNLDASKVTADANDIRIAIQQMVDEENTLLIKRQAATVDQQHMLFLLIVLSTLSLAGLVLVTIYLFRKLSLQQEKIIEENELTENILRKVSEAETSTNAYSIIIKEIGTYIDWDMGEAWTADKNGGLIANGTWYNPQSKNVKNLKDFHKLSLSLPLNTENCVPGKCFIVKEPVWITLGEFNEQLIRSSHAKKLGINSVFAVPIITDDQPILVINFLSTQVKPKNTDQLNLIRKCAGQVGLILKRKIMEEELILSEQRFKLISEATKDVIWDWNLKKNEFWFSSGLQTLFGYSEEEVGKHLDWWIEHIHPEDRKRVTDDLHALINHPERKNTWSEEYRFRCQNGHYIEVYDRGHVTFDENNQAIRMLGTMMDITERKKLEKMKTEFVSMVSHELRTPLTSIRGSLGLILGGTAGTISEKATHLLSIAFNNCERLVRLINDILDIEKIEAGKIEFNLETLDLKTIILEAVNSTQSYATKFHVSLATENLTSCTIKADHDRLIQVLTNLISNAVKFSPPGEVVTVTMEIKYNKVFVKVVDHGEGIAPAFHNRIFQRFAQADSSNTRQKGGTGLGLSISKTIIEHFHGKLGFNSKLGKGSTFYFELPITEIKSLPSTPAKFNQEEECILIIEDDADIGFLLRELLLQNGFAAHLAQNAKEARDLLAKNKYVAATLDLILPDADGINLLQEIRDNPATSLLPIIIISVKADETHTLVNGQAFPIIDWINKPVDIKRLEHCLRLLKLHMPKKDKHTILHIEDDEDIISVVNEILSSDFLIRTAFNIDEAKKRLEQEKFDLALLDLKLPDGNGATLIPLLTKHHIPIVVFSAYDLPDHHLVTTVLTKSHTSNEELLEIIKKVLQDQAHKERK